MIDYYLIENLNLNDRINSSSGGVIPLISQYIISIAGVVYGVTFNNDFLSLKYCRIDLLDELYKIQGSKYIDVNLEEDVISNIETDLKNNRTVLFIGRPCQIFKIKNKFKHFGQLLICIEISCYGVMPDTIWINYISNLKNKHGDIQSIEFRNKSTGWKTYKNKTIFKNGTIIDQKYTDNSYIKQFLSKKFHKQSCIKCQFHRNIDTFADIQCGDAWGVENLGYIHDNKGTSICVVYSDIMKKVIQNINGLCKIKKITYNQFLILTKYNAGLRNFKKIN